MATAATANRTTTNVNELLIMLCTFLPIPCITHTTDQQASQGEREKRLTAVKWLRKVRYD